jgi:hypothetical protein
MPEGQFPFWLFEGREQRESSEIRSDFLSAFSSPRNTESVVHSADSPRDDLTDFSSESSGPSPEFSTDSSDDENDLLDSPISAASPIYSSGDSDSEVGVDVSSENNSECNTSESSPAQKVGDVPQNEIGSDITGSASPILTAEIANPPWMRHREDDRRRKHRRLQKRKAKEERERLERVAASNAREKERSFARIKMLAGVERAQAARKESPPVIQITESRSRSRSPRGSTNRRQAVNRQPRCPSVIVKNASPASCYPLAKQLCPAETTTKLATQPSSSSSRYQWTSRLRQKN